MLARRSTPTRTGISLRRDWPRTASRQTLGGARPCATVAAWLVAVAAGRCGPDDEGFASRAAPASACRRIPQRSHRAGRAARPNAPDPAGCPGGRGEAARDHSAWRAAQNDAVCGRARAGSSHDSSADRLCRSRRRKAGHVRFSVVCCSARSRRIRHPAPSDRNAAAPPRGQRERGCSSVRWLLGHTAPEETRHCTRSDRRPVDAARGLRRDARAAAPRREPVDADPEQCERDRALQPERRGPRPSLAAGAGAPRVQGQPLGRVAQEGFGCSLRPHRRRGAIARSSPRDRRYEGLRRGRRMVRPSIPAETDDTGPLTASLTAPLCFEVRTARAAPAQDDWMRRRPGEAQDL